MVQLDHEQIVREFIQSCPLGIGHSRIPTTATHRARKERPSRSGGGARGKPLRLRQERTWEKSHAPHRAPQARAPAAPWQIMGWKTRLLDEPAGVRHPATVATLCATASRA